MAAAQRSYRALILGRDMRGEDVRRLQRSLNRLFDHYKIDNRVAVDGSFGPKTYRAARQMARAMGVTVGPWRKIVRGKRIPIGVQRLLNGERRRNRAERVAHARRVPYRKALRAAHAKPKGPRIYTGIVKPAPVFGGIGPLSWGAGHYSGGRKDKSTADCIALTRSFDSYHRSLGWGGLAYHFVISSEGDIICGRPIRDKGAHVAGHNTGTVGVVMPGTTGDRPTSAQQFAFNWLLDNAHTAKMPAAHRAPRRLRDLPWKGHFQFPGQSTACPGQYLTVYTSKGARR